MYSLRFDDGVYGLLWSCFLRTKAECWHVDRRKRVLMATSEAQKRANARYRKKSVKQMALRFYPVDMDLWEWLCGRKNRQAYIRELIRADMKRCTEESL